MSLLPVLVLPPAKADILTAARCFDEQRPGHGQVFVLQLFGTLLHIREFPESCQRFLGDYRRALLHRFKHAVVYRCLPNGIEVVGVMRDRRDPAAWPQRTGN